jgi:hypothetical protein
VSSTWRAKIRENRFHSEHRCSPSLEPCSHVWGVSLVKPSPLCPDPSRETWRRGGRTRPDPPPLCPAALCTTPTGVSSPEHAHSTPSPRQHPAGTPPRPPRPALLAHAARHRPSMPLETLAPVLSRAYKKPPSTPRRSTHPPLPIPTLLSSSLPRSRPISVRVRRRVPGDSGRRGASAGARWRSGAAAVDLLPRRQALLPLRRAPAVEHSSLHASEPPALAEVDDGRAPLDSDPAAAYRFGAVM